MTAAPFPTSLDHLAELIDQVSSRHEPVVITRGSKKAVLISLDDYGDRDATAYLLSTSTNKRRLLESIAQSRSGTCVERPIELVP